MPGARRLSMRPSRPSPPGCPCVSPPRSHAARRRSKNVFCIWLTRLFPWMTVRLDDPGLGDPGSLSSMWGLHCTKIKDGRWTCVLGDGWTGRRLRAWCVRNSSPAVTLLAGTCCCGVFATVSVCAISARPRHARSQTSKEFVTIRHQFKVTAELETPRAMRRWEGARSQTSKEFVPVFVIR